MCKKYQLLCVIMVAINSWQAKLFLKFSNIEYQMVQNKLKQEFQMAVICISSTYNVQHMYTVSH